MGIQTALASLTGTSVKDKREMDALRKQLGELNIKHQQLQRDHEQLNDEHQRIAGALKVCNTSVMMADTDLNIVYMNEAVEQMMADAEGALKTALPNFSARNLMGTCVDDFHQKPSHQRGMLKNLSSAYQTDLPVGGLTFGLIATPIFDDAGKRLGTVVEWLDKTEQLKKAAEEQALAATNARISQALDVCDTAVMMADDDLNIIYMNKAVQQMMGAAEAELKTALPNFNAKTLMGTCVDDFHQNPAHQRGMLNNLRDSYRTDLPVAGLTFGLIATPIFDENNERLGTVVEWQDKTAQLKIDADLADLATENARIKQALDGCDTSVMLADDDLNIIYMNNAVHKMMQDCEKQLQTALPNFNAKTLMGTCVDDFHKNPAHQRGMLKDLKTTYRTDLPVGGLTFGLIAVPIFDEAGVRLGTSVEWQDKTAQLKIDADLAELAKENARIKQALDGCDTSVMLADADLNIIYMNNAVHKMMQGCEKQLQTALPNFNAKTLMGTCVDDFHKNPAHQRGMLKDLKTTYRTDLPVGGLTFGLIATPIFNEAGERLGTSVEWQDKTKQLAFDAELAATAAANLRIKNALDVCDTSVMVADADLNIIYLNEAVKQMMAEGEGAIRTQLPNFSAKGLMGTCVDDFHKNPAHQRGMLKDLRTTYKTDLPIAELTFGLIATPLYDDNDVRLGTVVEWDNKTERLAKEAEEKRVADENLRIKNALDVCNTSVMMADADLNIIYLNESVKKMLRVREGTIRGQLSNFSVDNLMGFNVDNFHKNPAHQRGMLKELRDTYTTDLPINGLTFGLMATPLWNSDGERLGTVVEWDDKTDRLAVEIEERRLAAENARVKQALDSVSANVMIADPDFNLIYLNDAVLGMMRNAESDLRKDLPAFDTNKLMGANIDVFHKNPAHQRNMVGAMTSTFTGEIVVGGRTFKLTANPITVDGNRLGTVVEWVDRTAEVTIEREIDVVIEAAGRGDLTQQISLDDKDGFFKNLSGGLNSLVSTVEVALNDTLRMLGAMSRGDLTERITRDYQGSFGQLKDNANTTADKLTDVIGNVRSSSGAINSAANEIAQGNADLSQRTEEQASSLEETASSMEEMTSVVKQSAENASSADGLASEAKTKAQRGGEVVSQAVVAMEDINTSSKKIADIIGVIDEIAFQTNLLALNAAVEAARAGEQGRGFAVVAGEVRNLAQRSAGAAKEIKDLIRDSGDKVEDGTKLVNESGETLQEIVEAVDKVSTMIREISEAAQEQTSGIGQVNTAISQMDDMTQQNAALVEEASAAGEAMAEQARGMSSMMEFFVVDDSGSHGGASAAPTYSSASNSRVSSVRPSAPRPKSSDDDEWEEF